MSDEPKKLDFKAAIARLQAQMEAQQAADPEAYERERLLAEQRRQRAEEEDRRQRRRERLDAAGVTLSAETYDACVKGTLANTAALEAVKRWKQDRQKPWLILGGGIGVGKTHAAASTLAEEGGVWMPAACLVRTFAGRYPDSLPEQNRVRGAWFLVVDDVARSRSEADTNTLLDALLELTDARGNVNKTRTILTTNLSKADFKSVLPDPRLHSRFALMAQWETVIGPDLRRQPLAG